MSAQTTAASRASCVRTWTLMHLRWFGDAVPILPLTCESICAVAAQMKASGYRSFMNYADTLKSQHVEHYEWTPFLSLPNALPGFYAARDWPISPVSRTSTPAHSGLGSRRRSAGSRWTLLPKSMGYLVWLPRFARRGVSLRVGLVASSRHRQPHRDAVTSSVQDRPSSSRLYSHLGLHVRACGGIPRGRSRTSDRRA